MSCGLILSKDNELVNHVRVPDNYAPLRKELEKYHTSARKLGCPPSRFPFSNKSISKVSIALNPFTKGEYFVSFDDGTFYYNSVALGSHCEPPVQAKTNRRAHTRLRSTHRLLSKKRRLGNYGGRKYSGEKNLVN